ncbi:TolC family protein [Flavobacterium silvisoli]|uniref:TolC family protein n=1 Tax=Flavobacterium silvisoli TaxID=2529433 RepID=A0A4Q9YRL0_9FLAO|nr:TolC family protein [Flavobacterium silvisoli]
MKSLVLGFIFFTLSTAGQGLVSKELTYNEFLGYVKKFHPLIKSANLELNQAQANLMMARGAFDPKIQVDFEQKKFKDQEYYSLLNSSFKIPTWYGIEVKAGFDNTDGIYVNPQNKLPNQGLTSLGVAIPLAQGLLINQRMADLRKAKIQLNLSKAERSLMMVSVLYDASLAYFNWKRNFTEVTLYQEYLNNAQIRYDGVVKLIAQGDKPAIDSIEAGITVRNRKLSLEESRLKLAKSQLELSNFLWLEDNIPLELQENIVPEEQLFTSIKETLRTNDLLLSAPSLANHPKIKALENKIELLEVERKLKANMLLPKIDLGYSYLSEASSFDNYRFQDYKVGLNFYLPLFLRKERGSLQLAKYKLQDVRFDLDLERVQLKNKIKAQQTEVASLQKQQKILESLVSDYQILLQSEEKLFSFGESSLFLITSRENNLVAAQLSKLQLENRFYDANATLFKIMGMP